MSPKHMILPLALLALMFTACDNDLVSQAEYEAALSRADSLEARCDELELEVSDLRLYIEYLEGLDREDRSDRKDRLDIDVD